MVNHYRWDFIGLSTDEKPTPATSEKVADGSTFYCSDNSKLYVWYKNQWYEKEATGGGTTYTAGANITIADGVISATNTTYNDFLGTDGTYAGVAGLVPAPEATDAGKFLKSDGTWASAGGSSVTTFYIDYNDVPQPGNSDVDKPLYLDTAKTLSATGENFRAALETGMVKIGLLPAPGPSFEIEQATLINAFVCSQTDLSLGFAGVTATFNGIGGGDKFTIAVYNDASDSFELINELAV